MKRDYERDYERDSSIDPDALDVEWMQQANLAYIYGKAKAEAKKAMDLAWEHVKVTRSRLIKIKKEDDPKATGPIVEAYYRDHPDHKKAKQDFIDAEYEYNMADVAAGVISYQKRTALEQAVKLAYINYFATPADPRNLAEEIAKKSEKMMRQRAKAIREKSPRSRRRK